MSLAALRRRKVSPPAPVEVGDLLVESSAVSVALGDVPVLSGADLVARAGEVVALVGPNGAGKSTLLAALSGDVERTSGVVSIAGRRLEEWSSTELSLRRAVLPQHQAVTFPFTVREVIEMGRAPWVHVDGDPDGDRVIDSLIVDCDVTHLATRQMPNLSGGERARVGLARVLAQETAVLFLDEPTAALDLHHQELVLGLVRARAESGVAVVVVLHDLGLAAAHADRIAVLSGGCVVADGPPVAVLDDDLLSHVYGHAIEVVAHPRTGAPLVMPRR